MGRSGLDSPPVPGENRRSGSRWRRPPKNDGCGGPRPGEPPWPRAVCYRPPSSGTTLPFVVVTANRSVNETSLVILAALGWCVGVWIAAVMLVDLYVL
jgi:hypothetical protein